jgi:hypothetical protein
MWKYNKEEFTEDMIPEGAFGFIYIMKAVIDGKKVFYIGKKQFFNNVKVKLGKKEMAERTDKRTKDYKRVKRQSYKNYFSSNDVLIQANKDGIHIDRYILKICYSKKELTYEEVRYLFKLDVLESENYLNSNILGKFYRGKLK